jgi:hypothetical protein
MMPLTPGLASKAVLEIPTAGHDDYFSSDLECPSRVAETAQRLIQECATMSADEAVQRDRQFVAKYRAAGDSQHARLAE